MKFFTPLARIVIGVACLAGSSWAANIVQNPGFETGDFTSWTVNGDANNPWSIETTGGRAGDPFDGSFYASTGCVGDPCINGTSDEQSSLSQVLATASGTAYTLTFWFSTDGSGAPNELEVLWDGSSVLDLGPGGTLGSVPTYEELTVNNLIGTGSDTLTFLGRQDPSFDALDDVSVLSASSSSVPEPSTMLLIGGIIPVLAALRRRRSA
jgi:PEP-CTERM motif